MSRVGDFIRETPLGGLQVSMVGIGIPALAICGALAATGRGHNPISVPMGTERVAVKAKGERGFIPPVGLERFVTCGDQHNNLNTQDYTQRETLTGQKIEIICGSPDNPLPSDFPVEEIK